ncbi:hypothetical protein, partial [Curtobacterium pusillum]
ITANWASESNTKRDTRQASQPNHPAITRHALGDRPVENVVAGTVVPMGTGIQLIAGILVLLWGAFVVAFPRVIIKAALAAEKAGLAWNPQARWGTGWIRMLGAGLGVVGLVIVVTALFGLSGAD